MPRPLRRCPGNVVYHVLNRAVGRITLFRREADYAAFVRTLAQAHRRLPTDLLAWCVMPNHWHLVLRPTRDRQLSTFVQWLTLTHAQRWRTAHNTVGYGPLYQGRFKSFPVQSDSHLLVALRYVERNPLRANLVKRAQDWPWSSLPHRLGQPHHPDRSDRVARAKATHDTDAPEYPPLAEWPIDTPDNWPALVNRPQTRAEEDALRQSIHRSRPFGHPAWQQKMADKLSLQSSLRPRGRPRKQPQPA